VFQRPALTPVLPLFNPCVIPTHGTVRYSPFLSPVVSTNNSMALVHPFSSWDSVVCLLTGGLSCRLLLLRTAPQVSSLLFQKTFQLGRRNKGNVTAGIVQVTLSPSRSPFGQGPCPSPPILILLNVWFARSGSATGPQLALFYKRTRDRLRPSSVRCPSW